MAMGQQIREPSRTVRPGDLLDGSVAPNFVNTATKHNVTGALVGACDTAAPVYIGWHPAYFHDRMMSRPLASEGYNAVVFGPRSAVIDVFVDIHRTMSGQLRTLRDRSMILLNGVRILFFYLEDDPNALRSRHFSSVWIVGERQARQELYNRSAIIDEDRIGQVRSGYRGAVRAQYRGQVGESFELGGVASNSNQQVVEINAETLRQQIAQITGVSVGGVDITDAVEEVKPQKKEDTEPITFPERRLFLMEEE